MKIKQTLCGLLLTAVTGSVFITSPVSAADQQPAKQSPAATVSVNDETPANGVTVEKATPSERASFDSNAADDCKSQLTDVPNGITIKARLYNETEVHAKIKSHVRAKVQGKPQVTWMHENHTTNVSKSSIIKAPVVRVKTSMTSQDLYRKSHGAKYVRVIGTWRNTGMFGKIKAGFPTKSTNPGMIMVYNGASKKYEHGYTLKRTPSATDTVVLRNIRIGGVTYVLVQSCFNDFYGQVTVTFGSVVQLRSESEVIEDAEMEGYSAGLIELSGSKACPSGTIDWRVMLSSSAFASVMTKLQSGVIARSSGNGWAQAVANALAKAHASASGKSVGELNITCSDAPPPAKNPPGISVTARGCVDKSEGANGTVDFTVVNNNASADKFTVSASSGQNTVVQIGANAQVSGSLYQFNPGSYTITVESSNTGLKAVASVTVELCKTPATPKPMFVDIPKVNDVLVNNTRDFTVKGKLAPGKSGFVSASSLRGGSIIGGNTKRVSPDADGFFTVTFGYKAGDEPGTDQVKFILSQDGGDSVEATTDSFDIKERPATP